MKAAGTVAARLGLPSFLEDVGQYHADWHCGEEAARRAVFRRSARAADWAHFVGATARQSRSHDNEDDTVHAWRHRDGWVGTVRRAAGSDTIAEKCVSFLQPVFKLTRSTPTLLLFTAVWHCAFARLQEMHVPFGTKVAKALQRHYFEQAPTDTVKEVYGVKSWPGDDAGFAWSAPWWAGLDRLQRGSAAGSQAQESWHRRQLKAHIHNLYQTVRAFMDSLGAFCCDAISKMKDAKDNLGTPTAAVAVPQLPPSTAMSGPPQQRRTGCRS